MNYTFLFATAIAFGLINSVDIQLPSSNSRGQLDISSIAFAKGSRSSSSSSSSRSSSSSSSSSSSRTSSPSDSTSRSSSSSSSVKPSSPARSSSSYPSGGSTGGRAGGGSFRKPTSTSNPVRSQTQPSRLVKPKPVTVPRHVDVDVDIEIENSAPYQTVPNSSTAPPSAPNLQECNPNSTECNPNQTVSNPSTAGSTTDAGTFPTSTPATLSSTADSSDDSWAVLVTWGLGGLFFLTLSVSLFLVVYLILKRIGIGGVTNERDNNIVTVSKLQVALLGTTKGLQSELSELTLMADTQTPEGLLQLLQESALVLLRNSQNWTHVLASSQSVRSREEAEVLFKQLSVEKRSKFSAETLTNINGKVNHKEVATPDFYDGSADYIVVTLLVGTADDKPLFGEIRSAEALRDALTRVASIQPDYLLVFELLWSPQRDTDTLSYDQLLTEYTDMLQIV
ncbi:MAG: DUF1517 domain-containing protein [Coleofasciculus sp. S288]|nr:DUF1517 domain-containing protein [Coleofasciculus sp. S288]